MPQPVERNDLDNLFHLATPSPSLMTIPQDTIQHRILLVAGGEDHATFPRRVLYFQG